MYWTTHWLTPRKSNAGQLRMSSCLKSMSRPSLACTDRGSLQAISTEKDGTECEGWVCALRCQSNYPHQRQRQNTAAPASDSHRHVKEGLARSYVWWPGMDECIEKEVQSCEECQKHQKVPPTAPLHPWEWPESPRSRIHVDKTGPFLGEMFLLIVDGHLSFEVAYIAGYH